MGNADNDGNAYQQHLIVFEPFGMQRGTCHALSAAKQIAICASMALTRFDALRVFEPSLRCNTSAVEEPGCLVAL